MFLLSAFTPTTDIPLGGSVSSASVNTPDNNMENKLVEATSFNFSLRTAAATVTNTELVNFCNATSSYTLTLPSAVNSTNRLFIFKKIDSGFNVITIAASGSDTVESSISPLTTPIATNITLRLPDESVVLWVAPGTTNWRILERYNPYLSNLGARAYTVQSTSIPTNTPTTIQFDTESFDPSSSFDVVNHRYTAKVAGSYSFGGSVGVLTGSATTRKLIVRINGGAVEEPWQTASASGDIDLSFNDIFQLSANDYVDFQVVCASNSGSIRSSRLLTYVYFECVAARYT